MVLVRGHARNRGTYVAAGIAALTLGAFAAWAFWPPPPDLNPNREPHQTDRNYHAGGRDCEPQVLALITDRAAAQRSRDHCAAEREEHRLNEEVAAQTARAAQATEQAAQEAYQQARLAWTQALLLLVALGASIWAATAASRAAKAADETLRHAEDTAKRQLRAYVSMISCELAFMREGGRPKAVVIVQNTGQTPAYRFGGLLGIKPIGSDRQPEFPAIDLSDVPRI